MVPATLTRRLTRLTLTTHPLHYRSLSLALDGSFDLGHQTRIVPPPATRALAPKTTLPLWLPVEGSGSPTLISATIVETSPALGDRVGVLTTETEVVVMLDEEWTKGQTQAQADSCGPCRVTGGLPRLASPDDGAADGSSSSCHRLVWLRDRKQQQVPSLAVIVRRPSHPPLVVLPLTTLISLSLASPVAQLDHISTRTPTGWQAVAGSSSPAPPQIPSTRLATVEVQFVSLTRKGSSDDVTGRDGAKERAAVRRRGVSPAWLPPLVGPGSIVHLAPPQQSSVIAPCPSPRLSPSRFTLSLLKAEGPVGIVKKCVLDDGTVWRHDDKAKEDDEAAGGGSQRRWAWPTAATTVVLLPSPSVPLRAPLRDCGTLGWEPDIPPVPIAPLAPTAAPAGSPCSATLSWHHARHLVSLLLSLALPHTLTLTGPRQCGKRETARQAAAILSASPSPFVASSSRHDETAATWLTEPRAMDDDEWAVRSLALTPVFFSGAATSAAGTAPILRRALSHALSLPPSPVLLVLTDATPFLTADAMPLWLPLTATLKHTHAHSPDSPSLHAASHLLLLATDQQTTSHPDASPSSGPSISLATQRVTPHLALSLPRPTLPWLLSTLPLHAPALAASLPPTRTLPPALRTALTAITRATTSSPLCLFLALASVAEGYARLGRGAVDALTLAHGHAVAGDAAALATDGGRGATAAAGPLAPPPWSLFLGQPAAVAALTRAVAAVQRGVRGPIAPRTSLLLYGPPGCGKSALVMSLVHKYSFSLHHVRGPELLSKYIGESEAGLRRVFTAASDDAIARQAGPTDVDGGECGGVLLLIDDVDSLFPPRGDDGASVTDRMVNTLLALLDGISGRSSRLLICATSSRIDKIDRALLRPGRFDTCVRVEALCAGDADEQVANEKEEEEEEEEDAVDRAVAATLADHRRVADVVEAVLLTAAVRESSPSTSSTSSLSSGAADDSGNVLSLLDSETRAAAASLGDSLARLLVERRIPLSGADIEGLVADAQLAVIHSAHEDRRDGDGIVATLLRNPSFLHDAARRLRPSLSAAQVALDNRLAAEMGARGGRLPRPTDVGTKLTTAP